MTPCDVYTNKLESHYTAALVMCGAEKCRDTVEFEKNSVSGKAHFPLLSPRKRQLILKSKQQFKPSCENLQGSLPGF